MCSWRLARGTAAANLPLREANIANSATRDHLIQHLLDELDLKKSKNEHKKKL